MARIRSIKPEFATDSEMLDMTDSCLLFFFLLWTQCDDEGKVENDPKSIAKKIARWHKGKVQLYINSLLTQGQLRINSTSTWLQVTNFSHQRPNKPVQPNVKASDLVWVTTDDYVRPTVVGTEDERIGVVEGEEKEKESRGGSDVPSGDEKNPVDPEEKKTEESSAAPENDSPEKATGLHQKIIDTWFDWRKESTGVKPKVGGADVKAAERLVRYFLALNDPPDEERALLAWKYILKNWNKLDNWTRDQVGLNQIESRLNNIIEQLRGNGSKKPTGGKPTADDVAAEILKGHGVAPTGPA